MEDAGERSSPLHCGAEDDCLDGPYVRVEENLSEEEAAAMSLRQEM